LKCGPLIVVAMSLVIGVFTLPNTLTEVCHLGRSSLKNKPVPPCVITGFYLVLLLVLKWRLTRAEANVPNRDAQSSVADAQVFEAPSDQPATLNSVTTTLWISLTVRVTLQTALGITIQFSMMSLEGGLLQSLIIEHILEHSQLIVATFALLFNDEVNDAAKSLLYGEDRMEALPVSEPLFLHGPQTHVSAVQQAEVDRYSFAKQFSEPAEICGASKSRSSQLFSTPEICLSTAADRMQRVQGRPTGLRSRPTDESELSLLQTSTA